TTLINVISSYLFTSSIYTLCLHDALPIYLGIYGGYNYRVKHQTLERNNTPGAGKTKTVNTRLTFTEDFNYGLLARIGFNRVVFYGRYRWSSLFTDKSGFAELPRYEVGVRFGLHQ